MSATGEAFANIAAASGGSLFSTGLGLLTNNMLQKQNYKWAQKAANEEWSRQMQLYERQYKDKSPLNVVNQLKEAGLNKNLMFSGGASGVGGAAFGSKAPSTQQFQTQHLEQTANLALTAAQIKNINADTQLKEANVPKVGAEVTNLGATTSKLGEEIKLIGQQTKNLEIANKGIELDNGLKQLETSLKTESLSTNIEQLKTTLDKTKNEINSIIEQTKKTGVEASILSKSEDTIVETYNQTLKNLITNGLLMNKEINVKQQEIFTAVQDRVLNKISTMANKNYQEFQIELGRNMQELQQDLVKMQVDQSQMNAIMNVVGTVVGALVLKGAFTPGRNVVGGFK